MVGYRVMKRLRALGAAFGCAVLAACAATPARVAPIAPNSAPAASTPQLPFSPDAPPRVIDPGARSQCVPYARRISGIEIYGNANTWWVQAAGRYPRSNLPAPGAVLVTRGFRDASRGHVAVVTEVVSSRIVRVDHANWLNQGEISVGVPVLDVSAANDWSQVRVWHIPGGQWGARVYEVEGFIHAFFNAATTS